MQIQTGPKAPLPQQPRTQYWTVEKEVYDDTADLVSHSDGKDGKDATYGFTLQPDATYTKSDRWKHAAAKGAGGAVVGAIGGAFVGAMISFLEGAADLAGQVLGNPSSEGLGMVIPVVSGAILGAGYLGLEGYKDNGQAARYELKGQLQAQDNGLNFYVNGQLANKVHLNGNSASDLIAEYQKLPHVED